MTFQFIQPDGSRSWAGMAGVLASIVSDLLKIVDELVTSGAKLDSFQQFLLERAKEDFQQIQQVRSELDLDGRRRS